MNYNFKQFMSFKNGLEKQTGQTCTFHLERFVETSGTYKLVTSIGFEHFAQALGNFISQQFGQGQFKYYLTLFSYF
jgi:hypothetical protein